VIAGAHFFWTGFAALCALLSVAFALVFALWWYDEAGRE
jgi:hypothetical protein